MDVAGTGVAVRLNQSIIARGTGNILTILSYFAQTRFVSKNQKRDGMEILEKH